jgi:hypothetical protein
MTTASNTPGYPVDNRYNEMRADLRRCALRILAVLEAADRADAAELAEPEPPAQQ